VSSGDDPCGSQESWAAPGSKEAACCGWTPPRQRGVRASGNYGNGSAALDLLKQACPGVRADVVLFLTERRAEGDPPPARRSSGGGKNRQGDTGNGLLLLPDLAPLQPDRRPAHRGSADVGDRRHFYSLAGQRRMCRRLMGHTRAKRDMMDVLTTLRWRDRASVGDLVTALSTRLSTPRVRVLLLGQNCRGEESPVHLAHIRRYITLAHRMRQLRNRWSQPGGAGPPCMDVGGAPGRSHRPSAVSMECPTTCRTHARPLQRAFRTAFTRPPGKRTKSMGFPDAGSLPPFTAWWTSAPDAWPRPGQERGQALDQVMACLPPGLIGTMRVGVGGCVERQLPSHGPLEDYLRSVRRVWRPVTQLPTRRGEAPVVIRRSHTGRPSRSMPSRCRPSGQLRASSARTSQSAAGQLREAKPNATRAPGTPEGARARSPPVRRHPCRRQTRHPSWKTGAGIRDSLLPKSGSEAGGLRV